MKSNRLNILLLIAPLLISCNTTNKKVERSSEVLTIVENKIIVGANQTDNYLGLLKSKKVGVVANQTSVIFKEEKQYTHLVDSLLSLHVNITKVFAPEHGFRGKADAGEHVDDGIDKKTGLPIISLYGKNTKPSLEHLKDIDIMIFDIQDVGVRFYTYLGTFHYVMEACAEANIPVLILDRPNPNGHYIDGPILEMEYKSLVGMHPVPIVHAMTIGEYLQMVNKEGWLKNGIECDVTVITNQNYTHQMGYSLPIKPSPNLPNDKAINLYASLCFFEGTNVSLGRGTEKQFQIYGSPFMLNEDIKYCFTPHPNFGAKHPIHQNKECCGYDLSEIDRLNEINLSYLLNAYSSTANKEGFYNKFFIKLAGTKKLQQQIDTGLSEAEIKESWREGLIAFKKTREKYLLYN